MTRSGFRLLPLSALPVVLLAAAACSSSNNNTSTNNTNTGSKPAPVASVAAGGAVAAGSPAAAAGSPAVGGPAAAGVSQTFDEMTTDNKFSVTKMTTAANKQVTVTITNKGAAVHNWHVLDVQDAAGKDIKGALLDPGKSETVTFTISKPGTYKFQCDVHPADMTGTLTVQ